MGLRTPDAIYLGSRPLSPAPPLFPPGLGSSQAISATCRGSGCCTWVTTLGPERATCRGCSLSEAAF